MFHFQKNLHIYIIQHSWFYVVFMCTCLSYMGDIHNIHQIDVLCLGARPPEDPSPPPVTVKPTTTVARSTPVSPVCSLTFDCVAYIRGEIFAFKDDRFWRVRNLGEPLTPPEGQLSTSFFQDLPSGIQAAYERAYDQRIVSSKVIIIFENFSIANN